MGTIIPAPPAHLQKQFAEIERAVGLVQIVTAEDYEHAGIVSGNISRMLKQVADTFDPIIQKTHEAWKEALAQKNRFKVPLELKRQAVDSKMLQWRGRQEEIRRQREAELAAQKKKEQEDQAIAEAEQLVREGDALLAEEVLKQQAEAPAPVVALPSSVPKVDGFAKRVNWRFRIKDEKLVPRDYLRVDEIKIGGVVRALKGATKIPGVEVFSEESAIHRDSQKP